MTDSVLTEEQIEQPPLPLEDERADNLRELVDRIDRLYGEVRGLGEQFNGKLRYDQVKERVIDSLHQEVQQHRQGLMLNLLRPTFVDLIALHDDLSQFAASLETTSVEAAAYQPIRSSLASFAGTVQEILARQSVVAYFEPEEEFNARRQRAIKVVATTDPQLANHIVERLRKGFEFEGRVLRPELVSTYRYSVPVDQHESEPESSSEHTDQSGEHDDRTS